MLAVLREYILLSIKKSPDLMLFEENLCKKNPLDKMFSDIAARS